MKTLFLFFSTVVCVLVDDKTMFIYKTRQKNAGLTKNKTTTTTAVAAFLGKQDKYREPINVELLSSPPPV